MQSGKKKRHKLHHPGLTFDFKTKDLIGSYQTLLFVYCNLHWCYTWTGLLFADQNSIFSMYIIKDVNILDKFQDSSFYPNVSARFDTIIDNDWPG